MLSYLSYLFGLWLLLKDSYLLEGLQSADKTKTHPKAKLRNAPTFTRNGSHYQVCLLLVKKIKTCAYQLYKWQSADTNVLISRYRLSAKRPIIGQYRLMVHVDLRHIKFVTVIFYDHYYCYYDHNHHHHIRFLVLTFKHYGWQCTPLI